MDLIKIKPNIILPDFFNNSNNSNNLNIDTNVNKNIYTNVNKNIYPNLNDLNIEENKYEDINDNIINENIIDKKYNKKIQIDNEKIYNYIYKSKYIKSYTNEEILYRDNFLFNLNNERYFLFGKHLDFDPLIFENEFKSYPSYVKYLYYTKISPENKIVRLSRLTNLYLNLCFENQNFSSFYRIMYYPLYDLMIKKKKIINENDIKLHFINDKIINNYGNIEIFFNKENKIIRDFDYKHLDIIKYNINDIQPTNWSYKNLHDYIPICFIPHIYYKNVPYLKHYPDCKNLVMSNICFHNNDCHDYWCKTHNYNENQSLNYVHNHDYFQNFYKFNKTQLIDIFKLSLD